MGHNELAAKVRQLKELKLLVEEATAEIESIQDTIKAEMTAQGTEELTVDVFKIRWQSVTSNRFDSSAFKSTHAELYAQYTRPTTCRRFTVA